jgi:hypothetical protein
MCGPHISAIIQQAAFAGSDLARDRGALVDDRPEAAPVQRQRRRQATDTSADDDNPQRPHDQSLRIRRSTYSSMAAASSSTK